MSNPPPDNQNRAYVFGQNQDPHGQQYQQNQLPPKYKLTADELRVIRECNRESFWSRCVPLASVWAGGVYVFVKQGWLAGNPRFGPAPKMFTAAVLGYFIGKISYQSKCVEKIMQLPNSPMAEMLRKNKGGSITDTLTLDPGFYSSSLPVGSSSSDSGDVMDTRPMSNFDTESSSFVGFDKLGEPGEQLDEDELPPKSSSQLYTTTYDDLRRQNRIDYERQRQYAPQHDSRRGAPLASPAQQQQQFPSNDPPVQKRKNIYGDVWDDLPPK